MTATCVATITTITAQTFIRIFMQASALLLLLLVVPTDAFFSPASPSSSSSSSSSRRSTPATTTARITTAAFPRGFASTTIGSSARTIGTSDSSSSHSSRSSTSTIRNPFFSTTALASSARSTAGFGDARGRGVRDGQGRIELLCKAGPEGEALGDCPFCHYVQMVLRYKGLRYRLVPLAPEDKPEWLVEGYGGKMPCLVHDEEAYTDSATITQYLEYFFPGEVPLTWEEEDPELEEEVKAATSGVFGAFARYVKNLDKAQDPPLQAALFAELGKVDALLHKTGGPFLAGDRITLDDMALAPKLYHVKVGVAQFKNVIIPPGLDALAAYMRHMFDMEIFQESSYPPDIITWGWGNARK